MKICSECGESMALYNPGPLAPLGSWCRDCGEKNSGIPCTCPELRDARAEIVKLRDRIDILSSAAYHAANEAKW